MNPPSSQVSLFHTVARNGFRTSVLYLTVALALEISRKFYPHPALMETVRRLDDLPGTVLGLMGVLPELRRAFAYEQITEVGLRIIFGATTVAVIFALSFAVGGVVTGIRALLLRRGNSR